MIKVQLSNEILKRISAIDKNRFTAKTDQIPVITAKAIAATSNRLEMPSIAEGFDELYFVRSNGREFTIETWRNQDDF